MSISKESLEEVQKQVPQLKKFDFAIRDAITERAVHDYGMQLAKENYRTIVDHKWRHEQLLCALDAANGSWVRVALPVAAIGNVVLELRSDSNSVHIRLEDAHVHVSWERDHPLLRSAPTEKWLRAAYHVLPTLRFAERLEEDT